MSKVTSTINIPQPSIAGRIGTGIGRGLAEQLPEEISRGRMSYGLNQLANEQGLTPIQRQARLMAIPGVTPQGIQSFGELLRQQAIIDSQKVNPNQPPSAPGSSYEEPGLRPGSATTTESTKAALNPYIPPSGPEQEQMARQLMARDPQIYQNIESARAAIASQIAGNINQSNAKLAKRGLEESVQTKAEQGLRDEISTVGASIPGTVVSKLQQRAVDDVASGKLSNDDAKVKYGKEADSISRDFANIRSWGDWGLVTKNPKDLLSSITATQKNAKEKGYQKEAADAMIADNGLTPQFAYANMYPVSDIKPLNDEIKALPDIRPRIQKASGAPGLAGVGIGRPKGAQSEKQTLEIAPRFARAMGLEGSPLSIGYELEKKGYDSNVWKQYLLDHEDELNLSSHQKDELQKPKPSFFGWLNDWWLKSFTGVK